MSNNRTSEIVRRPDGTPLPGQPSLNPFGRPKRKVEQEYHDAMIGRVPMERWLKVVDKALEQAEAGDPVARKWIGEYLQGKPTEQINITSEPQEVIEVQWDYFPSLTDGNDSESGESNGSNDPSAA